ncbi:MAG: LamG domain-containing protein [Bacteroidota bacterium]
MMDYKAALRILLLILPVAWNSPGAIAQYGDLLLERIAHYPFSIDARDISGMGNHGIVSGALFTSEDFEGDGHSYYFDGVDDKIVCRSSGLEISSSVTVSCWIKTDISTENRHIVSKYNLDSDGGFILGIQEGYAKWAGRMGTGQFIRMTSASRVDDKRWHSLIGMVSQGHWYLYVDGILEGLVETGSISTDLSADAPLTFGYPSSGDSENQWHYEGLLDQVIIYGRPLNDCELEILVSGIPTQTR